MYMLSVLAHNRYSFIEITGVTNKSLIDIVREIQHVVVAIDGTSTEI
jgi:hypothetical protein